MLPTAGELQAMRDADIRQADRKQLKDIKEIQIDQSKSVEERTRSYLEQVQNPFLVKSGDYILKIQYADSDKTMTDCMMEYISNMIRLKEL